MQRFGALLVMTIVGAVACSSSSSSGGSDGGAEQDASMSPDSGQDSGSSCPGGQPMCNTTCCNANAVCVDDGTGNKSCAATCTFNSDCPPAKGCCSIVPGLSGKGACLQVGLTTNQQCRCNTTADCPSTGCCAPLADSNKNPIGPYVCKPNDNGPYNCCNGVGQNCSNGYCCVQLIGNGSYVCEEPCHNDGNCGPGACTMLTSGTCSGSPGGCTPK